MEIALRNRKSVANTFIASIAAVLMITLSGCGVVSDLADIGTAGNAFIAEMGKDDLRFSGGKSDSAPDKAGGAARLAAMKAMLSGGKAGS